MDTTVILAIIVSTVIALGVVILIVLLFYYHTLHIDGIDSSEAVAVFDLSGRPVLSTETSSDGILSLSGLSAGVYAVHDGHRGSTLIRLS